MGKISPACRWDGLDEYGQGFASVNKWSCQMWARFCRIVYEKSLRNIGQGFVSVNAWSCQMWARFRRIVFEKSLPNTGQGFASANEWNCQIWARFCRVINGKNLTNFGPGYASINEWSCQMWAKFHRIVYKEIWQILAKVLPVLMSEAVRYVWSFVRARYFWLLDEWSALFNDSRQLIDKCWRNFASLFCSIADFHSVRELGCTKMGLTGLHDFHHVF